MLAGRSKWQPRIPGGRATAGERGVTKQGWQARAQGPLPQHATKSQCHRHAELTHGMQLAQAPPPVLSPVAVPALGVWG